jgi:hypothetical protein
VTPSLHHELAKSLAIGKVARLAWRLPEISNSWQIPRAIARGAIAVRTTHLISPSPRENKMEIANWVLPVFGIGGPLSNPLGSLLVALAGYAPHILRARRVCWGCVGNCSIRHRRDEAALASQQGCRDFRRPWRMILSTSANMN